MASVVVQVRVDESERERWLAMAKENNMSLSDYIRTSLNYPPVMIENSDAGLQITALADANLEVVREKDKIIAENDAEIARLKSIIKRIEDMGVTLRPQSTDKDLQDKVSFGITYDRSAQVIAREQGLKNATGGLKGHALNCSCPQCTGLRGKK